MLSMQQFCTFERETYVCLNVSTIQGLPQDVRKEIREFLRGLQMNESLKKLDKPCK